MKRRIYSFIVLVLVAMVMAGLALLASLYEIHQNNIQFHQIIESNNLQYQKMITSNNRKFCLVISPAIAVPVPRPSEPAADPSRERTWEWYQRYLKLGKGLGCILHETVPHFAGGSASFRSGVSPGDQDSDSSAVAILNRR